MKKLKLSLNGINAMTKAQMKKISGGYGCVVQCNGHYFASVSQCDDYMTSGVCIFEMPVSCTCN